MVRLRKVNHVSAGEWDRKVFLLPAQNLLSPCRRLRGSAVEHRGPEQRGPGKSPTSGCGLPEGLMPQSWPGALGDGSQVTQSRSRLGA